MATSLLLRPFFDPRITLDDPLYNASMSILQTLRSARSIGLNGAENAALAGVSVILGGERANQKHPLSEKEIQKKSSASAPNFASCLKKCRTFLKAENGKGSPLRVTPTKRKVESPGGSASDSCSGSGGVKDKAGPSKITPTPTKGSTSSSAAAVTTPVTTPTSVRPATQRGSKLDLGNLLERGKSGSNSGNGTKTTEGSSSGAGAASNSTKTPTNSNPNLNPKPRISTTQTTPPSSKPSPIPHTTPHPKPNPNPTPTQKQHLNSPSKASPLRNDSTPTKSRNSKTDNPVLPSSPTSSRSLRAGPGKSRAAAVEEVEEPEQLEEIEELEDIGEVGEVDALGFGFGSGSRKGLSKYNRPPSSSAPASNSNLHGKPTRSGSGPGIGRGGGGSPLARKILRPGDSGSGSGGRSGGIEVASPPASPTRTKSNTATGALSAGGSGSSGVKRKTLASALVEEEEEEEEEEDLGGVGGGHQGSGSPSKKTRLSSQPQLQAHTHTRNQTKVPPPQSSVLPTTTNKRKPSHQHISLPKISRLSDIPLTPYLSIPHPSISLTGDDTAYAVFGVGGNVWSLVGDGDEEDNGNSNGHQGGEKVLIFGGRTVPLPVLDRGGIESDDEDSYNQLIRRNDRVKKRLDGLRGGGIGESIDDWEDKFGVGLWSRLRPPGGETVEGEGLALGDDGDEVDDGVEGGMYVDRPVRSAGEKDEGEGMDIEERLDDFLQAFPAYLDSKSNEPTNPTPKRSSTNTSTAKKRPDWMIRAELRGVGMKAFVDHGEGGDMEIE